MLSKKQEIILTTSDANNELPNEQLGVGHKVWEFFSDEGDYMDSDVNNIFLVELNIFTGRFHLKISISCG